MSYEIVDAEYVLANLDKLPILDVRPAYMYEESRIPGAESVRLMEAKESEEDTAEYFTRHVQEAGFMPEDVFIVYCYDGGLAREACGILDENGYIGLKCYEGSWVDWISDPSRPVEE